jgi:Phosphatidylinositol N-acetylglucosaminyltransferase
MLSHDYSAGPRNIIKYVLYRHYYLPQITVSLTQIMTRFPGSLSTNAAIFASVMLASRLQTNMGVFGLTAFAVEWFALFPIFRRHLQVSGIHTSKRQKKFQQTHRYFLLEYNTGRAHSIINHNASSFSHLVHSHLKSRCVHLYLGNHIYHLYLSSMAHQNSEIQKVSNYLPLLCSLSIFSTNRSKSEIHGPWDEAQPKLQPSNEKHYK